MRKLFLFPVMAVIATFMMFSCCKEVKKETPAAKIIKAPELKLTSDLMTPEVLWSFGRISNVEVSPDKSTILYAVKYFDKELNKGENDFYTIPLKGGSPKKITESTDAKMTGLWRPDGKKIGYISSKSGDTQLWEMNPDGSGQIQVTNIDGGINDFKYSPEGKKILYIKNVKLDKSVNDMYPDLPKANARLETDLMYRHWDSWSDYTYSHVYYADYNDGKVINPVDIMKDERFDSPLKPFGGMEQINFSHDGKNIVYTSKHQTGKVYSLSTNSDIFIYNIDTKKTTNLTEGMMGYDVAPVYSPDGKKIAWESMERDGYESDKNRLFIFDAEKGTKTDYTKDFDQNAGSLCWSDDSKAVYFISGVKATEELYRLNVADGKISRITNGIHDYREFTVAGNVLIGSRQSMSMPTEIFSVDIATGKETQLSFVNKPILDQLKMGEVTSRWIKTTDNKEMLTWVIYPPHFDKSKKYPTLLYCEGGPQSTVSQFWSYRWNFQIMAANGYIIVAPNRRGLPSFGKEWNEQISGDYGGQNMKDYFSAIDEVSKEPFVDKGHLGAVGASYGGFSVYWIAGHHNKRFKAFIAHDGMFNLEAQYLETEEMWFVNWDLGGPFWDKNNKIARRSYENSPDKFIQNWDTPILVIHGEKDFRIPYTQGMSAFNAAVLRNVPAEFLYFPEESHWVLSPQDGILWQRTFFAWLDKWLK
ncbi:MAG: S9 family peptidase [Bacteroidia bacterium]|nr:S9 family peptidase [Bacteroidia bacterium]